MFHFNARTAVLPALVLLAACTTPGGVDLPPPDTGSASNEAECNRALAALIGGAIGAVIYEEDRARGAAVGAGLGALACSIINATSRQTRSQTEVAQEYRASHDGQLPEQPLVEVYDTAYNASGGVAAGQEARVVSSITLVPGRGETVKQLREVLEVFEPGTEGAVLIKAEKRVEEASRAGAVQNSFTIRLPKGMKAGNYPARTTIYVNEREAGENRGTLRVLSG
jgi:hypothetical protein